MDSKKKKHTTGIKNITIATHSRWNGSIYKYFIFRKWINYRLYSKNFERLEDAIEYKEKFIEEHYNEIIK